MIKDIQKWIEEFVSVHNETIGQVPCPFAKQAMLDERINYVPGGKHTITPLLNSLASNWDEKYEVVVVYADKDELTPNELKTIVDDFNRFARDKDVVALEDHPNDPEILNGVSMNFGKAILILVQRLSKLNKASDILKKKGYYDNWPKDNYDDVVSWRFTD
jgi:hypothetical protein|tara:strand:- start:414 stop:896 length:483 start_codon:yes stop_codon:yes gene_type:complete